MKTRRFTVSCLAVLALACSGPTRCSAQGIPVTNDTPVKTFTWYPFQGAVTPNPGGRSVREGDPVTFVIYANPYLFDAKFTVNQVDFNVTPPSIISSDFMPPAGTSASAAKPAAGAPGGGNAAAPAFAGPANPAGDSYDAALSTFNQRTTDIAYADDVAGKLNTEITTGPDPTTVTSIVNSLFQNVVASYPVPTGAIYLTKSVTDKNGVTTTTQSIAPPESEYFNFLYSGVHAAYAVLVDDYSKLDPATAKADSDEQGTANAEYVRLEHNRQLAGAIIDEVQSGSLFKITYGPVIADGHEMDFSAVLTVKPAASTAAPAPTTTTTTTTTTPAPAPAPVAAAGAAAAGAPTAPAPPPTTTTVTQTTPTATPPANTDSSGYGLSAASLTQTTFVLPVQAIPIQGNKRPTFSTGIFITALSSPTYSTKTDSSGKVTVQESKDNFSTALGALVHTPISRDGVWNASAGVALNDNNPEYLLGLSIAVGSDQRSIFTLGIAGEQVNRLPGLDVGDTVTGDLPTPVKVFRTALFGGITYDM